MTQTLFMNRASHKPENLPLSAILLVRDEEENVRCCLESVKGLCGEILILDSGSTDRTIEICRHYSEKIFTHPFVDSASQWTWALANLPITHEWVLPLDADHVVSPELREDLVRALRMPINEINGYYSRHQYLFWGKPIRGFKHYGLRVFRRAAASVDSGERHDFKICVKGRTGTLRGTLYEHNRKELSIDSWIEKHQRFASRVAIDEVLRQAGVLQWQVRARLFGSPDERIVWMKNLWCRMPLFVRPVLYFSYRYFLRGGFLDGRVGFIYHFMQALWYRMLIDIKVAGIRRDLASGALSIEDLQKWTGADARTGA
jgi:glycosyltransferase involved in cell wall biosynthesis